MSRRVEITVPNEWAPLLRSIIQDADKLDYSETSTKPHMMIELNGPINTVFMLTVPAPAVAGVLTALRKNGIGVNVGRVILTSLDYLKPDLSKPLTMHEEEGQTPKEKLKKGAKPPPLKGFAHFQKARKTTEEMYNEISNGASMTINTWINLLGASTMAAGGLTTGVLVFVVASMLVSPIMGPILGMTLGYRVADWPLFKTGFINEMKMAIATFACGCVCGMVLGDVGNTYKWPNNAMMPEGQGFNLVISIIVSAAAGSVLGVSLTSTGGNALVGTAISAGLLPPLVNAGMLMSYATVYGTRAQKAEFYELGYYSILFYFTHVITIVAVANFIFYLKDVDPRFREGEDSNFNDIPSLVEHKKLLELQGKDYTEKEKAEFFIEHIKADLKNDVTNFAKNVKGRAENIAHIISGGKLGRRASNGPSFEGEEEEGDIENPIQTSTTTKQRSQRVTTSNNINSTSSKVKFSAINQHDDDDSHIHDEESGDINQGIELTSPNTSMNNPVSNNNNNTSSTSLRLVPPSSLPTNNYQSAPSTSSNIQPVPKIQTIPTKSLQDQIADFYKIHNPSKLNQLDEILLRYKGKEKELLSKLYKQYNISSK